MNDRALIAAMTIFAVLIGSFIAMPSEVEAQEERRFTNLRHLPKDISRDDLGQVMLENLRGLGLPRRQSQGCLFCHVGDSEEPSSSWDFASDSKPEKLKAREMLAMVDDINQRLAGLKDRIAPDLKVTCYSCHSGRTDPRSLPDLLLATYDSGGVDELYDKYETLRERYFGGDAYDFRPNVLAEIAIGLADAGSYKDALVVANINVAHYSDVAGIDDTGHVIQLEQAYAESGIESALSEFDDLRSMENATWASLDLFGWRLERRGKATDAIKVFRRNLDLFPDLYIPNESMGDATWFVLDDLGGAIAIFEKWLEAHPDHEMARRRVATLRAEL